MTQDEIALALRRLGAGRDAEPLLDLLYGELQGVSGPGLADGALRHNEGRRSLALELIRRLEPASETSSGRSDADSTEPGPGTRRGSGVGRRVPPTDPERFPKR